MKRQVNCKHYEEQSKKTSVYTYRLPSFELNLCNRCEKRLRKHIIEQDNIEKWSKMTVKNWKSQNKRIKREREIRKLRKK